MPYTLPFTTHTLPLIPYIFRLSPSYSAVHQLIAYNLKLTVIFVIMEVNDAMVTKLAHLARLEYSGAEKEEIKSDLQRMIAFVEKLNELDLDGVEPLLHMSDETNVLREDVIKGSVSRQDALLNAPENDGQFFKVPKVIKKD